MIPTNDDVFAFIYHINVLKKEGRIIDYEISTSNGNTIDVMITPVKPIDFIYLPLRVN